MDAFEQVVSEILWNEGFWTRTSVKVDLTKEEKVDIGRPSSPRWEIDVVAYSGRENVIWAVECKSYLDSRGVSASGFRDGSDVSRYKLFNDTKLRTVVFNRLRQQLADCGACSPDAIVRLALACGKIYERDRLTIKQQFDEEGWALWDETWFKEKLLKISGGSYENQVSAVVSKLLLRGGHTQPASRVDDELS